MVQKVEAQGGKGGTQWDDRSEYVAVTKIEVGTDVVGIQYVKFSYLQKNGETKEIRHSYGYGVGHITASSHKPFVINHPEEHLVSVEGWYDHGGLIQGLTFHSNKKTSDFVGKKAHCIPFTLEVKDKKIIGFHGSGGFNLHSLGAYFAPLTKKLSAVRGTGESSDKETEWDDGAYDGVKKVYVGQGQEGISSVKFVYDKGSEEVVGKEHGESTMLGFDEFELDYPSEYITEVEGTYDTTYESNGPIITMLKFKTNKRTSKPYGLEAGEDFSFKEEGSKIVGFHGSVGALLRSFGVHVLPISN